MAETMVGDRWLTRTVYTQVHGSQKQSKPEDSAVVVTKLPLKMNYLTTAVSDSLGLDEKVAVKSAENIPSPLPTEGNSMAKASRSSSCDAAAGYYPEDPHALKKEIEEKEKLVQSTIQDRFKKMEEEEQKLRRIKQQLKKMNVGTSNDFHIIRAKIENVGRDLSYAESDLREKERECREINETVLSLRDEKQQLTEHLRIIIYENEKKKQEKLRELMQDLDLGDVSEEEVQKAWKGFNVWHLASSTF